MHLAILMTNTDESAFAKARPRDGEKFTTLIKEARPTWTTEVFSVKDGVFPDDLSRFDGVMITGSPASVHDDAPWIGQLFDLIRYMDEQKIPMFGACFGHQAIAVALGGEVVKNPNGWVHGATRVTAILDLPFEESPDSMTLYASHSEQVTSLPDEAVSVTCGEGCAIGGFMKGNHIFTSQYHPEMSDAFIADLIEETADYVGPEVTARARASLTKKADRAEIAQQIAGFFEWAC